jgi:CheY-like chemotaxis protein
VLLVDDGRPLLRLGAEMLAALGHEPVGLDNAARAPAALRADPGRFGLALSDASMPEMTGYAGAAAAFRGVRRTGKRGSPEDRRRCPRRSRQASRFSGYPRRRRGGHGPLRDIPVRVL